MSSTQRRLSHFVTFIAPDRAMRDRVSTQSQDIRSRIAAKAREDGLTVERTLNAGSYAKATGLRRYLQNDEPVEGMDVDLAFVVRPDGDRDAGNLIQRFLGYADSCYPHTEKKPTKSSVQLDFAGTKLRYDLVPLVAGESDTEQWLIRRDGEWVYTSVQRHIDVVKRRTKSSDEAPGRVRFNECVRLVKWWDAVRESRGGSLSVPTIVLGVLCARNFDERNVRATYIETLADWFA